MFRFVVTLFLFAVFMVAAPANRQTPLIIDTDMGADDVMAIALILAHREIPVEAITVVNGLAHVRAGAANARRLVAASGRAEITVYEGRETPLQRTGDFPADWRRASDEPLSKLNPPATTSEPATVWLARRLKDPSHPVRILALGPLTNLAIALPGAAPKAVEEVTMMGGAFRVAGNMGDLAVLQGQTPVAEGNFWIDPEAAARVFRSGVPLRVMPLDATNKARMDTAFVARFDRVAKGPLADIVRHVLAGAHQFIAEGSQYAWDALAAASAIDPAVATWTPAHVSVLLKDRNAGRSVMDKGPVNAQVALDATRARFDQIFIGAFVGK